MPNRNEFNAFLNGKCRSYPGSLETIEFNLYAQSVLGTAFAGIYNCTDIAQLKSLYNGLQSHLTPEAQSALSYGGNACRPALGYYADYLRQYRYATNDHGEQFRPQNRNTRNVNPKTNKCKSKILTAVVDRTKNILSFGAKPQNGLFGANRDQRLADPDNFDFMDYTWQMAQKMRELLDTLVLIPEGKDRNAWGRYFHSEKCIMLFMDSIEEYCDMVQQQEFLIPRLVVTLIHELAHAVMDVTNYDGHQDRNSDIYRGYLHEFYGWNPDRHVYDVHNPARYLDQELRERRDEANPEENRTIKVKPNFYTVREESFANVITFQVISEAYKYMDPIDRLQYSEIFLEDFMKGQSSEYKLALYIRDAKNIKGWMLAKEADNCIQEKNAESWMDEAGHYLESNENGNYQPKEYYAFYQKELSLGMPWAR